IELYIFFFSSRRRHTRFSRDWSSDVCSSDLRGVRFRIAATLQRPSVHDWPPEWACLCPGSRRTHLEVHEQHVLPFHRDSRPFLRSEEHTSELQSRENLVCRLLLEKKKTKRTD